MKKLFLLPILFYIHGIAQVGINTSNPSASAALDITSNNKGVLFPRVSLQSMTDVTTIVNPAEGLTVWNTNTGLTTGKGFYYFVDGAWTKIPKQQNNTGKTYDFVDFKQTTSNIVMTSALQELTQLSTSYTAPSNGNLFLNYIIYATMASHSIPRVANTYCEIQVTDTTTSIVQKGNVLISPLEVVPNQGLNAVASPSVVAVNIIKGHTYTIKVFAKEAYLDSSYVIRVGTVSYSSSSANSSLLINSLLNP